jgi:uncharacterized phage protein (TIGR01671 family)
MREIKFRAWHKKRKKFYEILHLHLKTIMNGGIWATCEGYNIIEHQEIHIQIQPKDCEIIQYTGLKDKNAKEIYQSDLVKDEHGFTKEIVWSCYEWRLKGHDVSYPIVSYESDIPGHADLEIIGNIYENPELLN